METRARRFIHLTKSHHDLIEDASLLKFVIQLIALTNTLTNTGKDTGPFVLLHDIVNQLHDQNGLSAARTPDDASLASAHNGKKKVHDLDSCFDHLGFACSQAVHVYVQTGCIFQNGHIRVAVDGTFAINGLAHHINNSTE